MKSNKILFCFVCVLVSAISILKAEAVPVQGNIIIAAASDMKFALEELKENFIKVNPKIEVGLAVGSSGKLFEQIKNGAPFDIFFSADIAFPQKLRSVGIGDDVVSYGFGQLVLWSLKDKVLELEDLRNPLIKTIAIANPLHAPYGVRAVEAFKKGRLYDSIKDRLVFGENVSQAAQFVETGSAEVGVVALSVVRSLNLIGKGSYKIISSKLYSPLDQGFILLKKNNPSAKKFVDYMKSKQAKETLEKYGFIMQKKANGI